MLIGKLAVGLNAVRADSDYGDSLEPREGVAETARLSRSAGSIVFRIEKDDSRRARQVGFRMALAVLIRQVEVGKGVANF